MIRVVLSVFLLALLIMAAVGCRPADDTAPMVHITTPIDGDIFNVFDTVVVEFTVKDETQLVWASAKIVDENYVAVTASRSFQISTIPFAGFAELILDDKLLTTANYYVLITASDGRNEQREYRRIRINEMPKRRVGIMFSDRNGDFSGNIFRIDSLFQTINLFASSEQDIRRICIQSEIDRLTLIGNLSTGIRSYSTHDGSLIWSEDVFSVSQTPRFTDINCSTEETFVLLYDREIRGYDRYGGLTMNRQTGNFRPEKIHVNANYILVEMNLVGDNDHFIFVYHAVTKGLLWQIDVPMDVVSICDLQNDEVLLFGNEGGQAKVLHYDIGNNGYWEPRQLPSGKLIDAVKLDGSKFAFAHEDGIYSYTYAPNYLNLIRAGVVYQDISFDFDKRTIIGASYNTIDEIAENGTVQRTLTHTDSITSIDIQYTK